MSASILNPQSTRRIARSTGLNVIRAWSHGKYTMAFVTDDHRHGWWNKKNQAWDLEDNPMHYSSCDQLFPGYERTIT